MWFQTMWFLLFRIYFRIRNKETVNNGLVNNNTQLGIPADWWEWFDRKAICLPWYHYWTLSSNYLQDYCLKKISEIYRWIIDTQVTLKLFLFLLPLQDTMERRNISIPSQKKKKSFLLSWNSFYSLRGLVLTLDFLCCLYT